MRKTALFDLDGTLLPVDLDFFFKRYVDAVVSYFQDLIPKEKFTRALIQSTYLMVDNLDPALTNQEAFARSFAPMVGYKWEELWPIFQRFYREGFPGLKRYVPEREDARYVVESLLSEGWEVVLATNPIFPEEAIRERMRWCKIDDLPWLYVTTFESMHFCKPHLQYYREVCGILDLDPAFSVMIGNDVQEDIVAKKLGMKTFLVEEFLIDRGGGETPHARGRLRDVPKVLRTMFERSV